MGYDLYPMDTLAAKKAFAREAVERDMLIFFEHDPAIAAGRITERDGKRRIIPTPTNHKEHHGDKGPA
jgi:thymidylate kinase